jgi:hypothetical protein
MDCIHGILEGAAFTVNVGDASDSLVVVGFAVSVAVVVDTDDDDDSAQAAVFDRDCLPSLAVACTEVAQAVTIASLDAADNVFMIESLFQAVASSGESVALN